MAVDIPGMPALMRFARLRDAAFVVRPSRHVAECCSGANQSSCLHFSSESPKLQ